MIEETREEIQDKIRRIRLYWEKEGINANTFSKDLNPEIADLRSWFISRRTSLSIGSLSDDMVRIFIESQMDFGVKLLLWEDWAKLAETYLKNTQKDTIPETLIVENNLRLGRWAKRQLRSLTKLSPEQECRLIEIKLINKDKSSAWLARDKSVYYRGKSYPSVSAFARELNLSMNKAYLLLNMYKEVHAEKEKKGKDMDRNFNNCRFRLTLPTLCKKDGITSIMFSVQPINKSVGLLFMQECRIIDSLGEVKEEYNISFDPAIVDLAKGSKKIVVTFNEKVDRRKSIGMNLEYSIIDITAKKKIKVYYEIINDFKKNLLGIEIEECNTDNIVIPLEEKPVASQTDSLSIEEKYLNLKKQFALIRKEKIDLIEENSMLKNQLIKKNKEIAELTNQLKKCNNTPVRITNNMEEHLNNILDYMSNTAKMCGIKLSNIYVYTSTKDGKNHVNVRGEIYFADGVSTLSNGLRIKASLYDENGHIEIEGNNYLSSSFSGYDTFDIGWNGGTKESWLSETKIRIFVTKA